MRNLKRALSLALAAIMVLGLMIVGAGAADVYEDFTDKDEIQNSEAVATMVALGVIEGKEDGSYFDPTGTVTRAEMAKIVAVSLNGGQDPVMGNSGSVVQFSDVPTTHWAYNYIAYCVQQNIIAGRGNGTFGPEDPVTGSAAAKMFLCALGYRADLEGLTGNDWEINTNILANQDAGLYEGLSGINASAGLSRDNTAQMTYNAVQAQEVSYNNLQGDYSGVLQTQGKGTMLENRFGVWKITGIVTGNEHFALNAPALRAGKTEIQATEVTIGSGTENRPWMSVGDLNTFNVSTDADLIGQEVVIYLKPTSKLSPNPASDRVLGQAIVTDSNTVVTTTDKVDADDWDKFLRDSGFSTRVDAVATDGTDDGDYYVNYASAADGVTFDSNEASVELTLIDNDGDGRVEIMLKLEKAFGEVSVYNASKETLSIETTSTDADNVYYNAYGGVVEYDFADMVGAEDVARDDHVLWFTANGTTYVEKVETVDVTVDSKNLSKDTIEADGETYEKSGLPGGYEAADLTDDATVDVNNSYTLYLDNAGRVLLAEELEGEMNFAVVDASTYNGVQGLTARLVLADGTKVTADIAHVDGNEPTGTLSDAVSDSIGNVATTIYRYEINDDGSYDLEAYTASGRTYSETNGGNVDVKKNVPAIAVGSKTVYADADTIYLFYDSTDDTYRSVTGVGNISTNDGNAYVNAVYKNSNSIAKFVFVQDASITSSMSRAIFITDKDATRVGNGSSAYYRMNAIVDDEITTVEATSAGYTNIKNALAGSTMGLIVDPTTNSDGRITAVGSVRVPVTQAGELLPTNVTTVSSNTIVGTDLDGNGASSFTFNADTKFFLIDGDDVYGPEDDIDDGSISDTVDRVLVMEDNTTDDLARYVYILRDAPTALNGAEADADDIADAFNDGASVVTVSGNSSVVAAVPTGKTLIIDGNYTPATTPDVDGTLMVNGSYTLPASGEGATAAHLSIALAASNDVVVPGALSDAATVTVANGQKLTVTAKQTADHTVTVQSGAEVVMPGDVALIGGDDAVFTITNDVVVNCANDGVQMKASSGTITLNSSLTIDDDDRLTLSGSAVLVGTTGVELTVGDNAVTPGTTNNFFQNDGTSAATTPISGTFTWDTSINGEDGGWKATA